MEEGNDNDDDGFWFEFLKTQRLLNREVFWGGGNARVCPVRLSFYLIYTPSTLDIYVYIF